MEMRIVLPEASGTSVLAEWLTAVFGVGCVTLWPDQREVDVRVDGESDHTVLRVLDAVEGWLDHAGIGSAELWLGEHSYRIARWAPVGAWQ